MPFFIRYPWDVGIVPHSIASMYGVMWGGQTELHQETGYRTYALVGVIERKLTVHQWSEERPYKGVSSDIKVAFE